MKLTRRRFIEATSLASAASLLPRNVVRALANAASTPADLRQVQHIVVFTQENRSFDHYFGTLSGVRGFDDPKVGRLPNGKSLFYQPDPKNSAGYLLPFRVDTRTTSGAAYPSTAHDWDTQHACWNGGRMDSFVTAHRRADGADGGPFTMGYLTRQDIPFHYALADAFTICDSYHCSVMGPTNPNRLYLMTGTIDARGAAGGPVIDNSESVPYTWTTYPERLEQAGISWKVYQQVDNYDDNPLAWFAQYQNAPLDSPLYKRGIAFGQLGDFEADARAGQLPQVSWVITSQAGSEHPSFLPGAGAMLIKSAIDAVASNSKMWNSTVMFLNYDENDGLFDHVTPPTPDPNNPAHADEFVKGAPIGLGFRVPMIVISPFSVGGYVSSELCDHTSVLRFMERCFGVVEPNISSWRRGTCGDLTSTLNLKAADVAPQLPSPADELFSEYLHSNDDAAPVVPAIQTVPHQEPGTRPRR